MNSQTDFVVEKQFNAQSQSLSTFINVNEINIFNFFFRIKRVYKKNKKLQAVIKTKRNGERKISAKLIKKSMRLELGDCEIIDNLL